MRESTCNKKSTKEQRQLYGSVGDERQSSGAFLIKKQPSDPIRRKIFALTEAFSHDSPASKID